jgi:hypothetical protein
MGHLEDSEDVVGSRTRGEDVVNSRRRASLNKGAWIGGWMMETYNFSLSLTSHEGNNVLFFGSDLNFSSLLIKNRKNGSDFPFESMGKT